MVEGFGLVKRSLGGDRLFLIDPHAGLSRQAAMIAYNNAFGYMCLTSVVMVPLLFMLRPADIEDAAPAKHPDGAEMA